MSASTDDSDHRARSISRVVLAATLGGAAVTAVALWARLSHLPLSTAPYALSSTPTPCADSYALVETYVGTIENDAPRLAKKHPTARPTVPWLSCGSGTRKL